MPEINDVRLVVEIKNKHPLELLELTKSLVSLANQFNSYTSDLNTSKEDREAKLYVKEIRTGSVILELIEVATIGVLPFIENINTLVSFAEYLRDSYQYFLGSPRGKPKEFSISDQRDLSQIINPIANDNGSQINVSVNVGEGATVYLAMGSLEANAIQNTIAREVAKSREPEPSDDIRHKVAKECLSSYGGETNSNKT